MTTMTMSADRRLHDRAARHAARSSAISFRRWSSGTSASARTRRSSSAWSARAGALFTPPPGHAARRARHQAGRARGAVRDPLLRVQALRPRPAGRGPHGAPGTRRRVGRGPNAAFNVFRDDRGRGGGRGGPAARRRRGLARARAAPRRLARSGGRARTRRATCSSASACCCCSGVSVGMVLVSTRPRAAPGRAADGVRRRRLARAAHAARGDSLRRREPGRRHRRRAEAGAASTARSSSPRAAA